MMNLGFGGGAYGAMPMMPSSDFSVAAPLSDMWQFDQMGGGLGHQIPQAAPPANNMQANLAAWLAAQGQQGSVPNFMAPQMMGGQMQQGGAPNFMNPNMIGGGMPRFPQQQGGGYDSSGINPNGMYNGTFGQPQFPQNPGGFSAMRNLGFGGR